VVGVARHARGEERTQYRAGVVVQSLAELELPHSLPDPSATAPAPELPSALEN
jgi:hypothetical protein